MLTICWLRLAGTINRLLKFTDGGWGHLEYLNSDGSPAGHADIGTGNLPDSGGDSLISLLPATKGATMAPKSRSKSPPMKSGNAPDHALVGRKKTDKPKMAKRAAATLSPHELSIRPAGQDPANRLNRIDRQLLSLLQEDARTTNLALAGAVGLSPAACHDRVRKLIEHGWIRGFTARLDPNRLGLSMLVFANIQVDRRHPKVIRQLQKAITANPQFLECHLVAGRTDVLVKIRTHNLTSYQQLLDEVIFPIRGVVRVDSQLSLQTLKESCAVPLHDYAD